MSVPRFRQTGSGRWRVEKRVTGWVAVSPAGHVLRKPSQAAAYFYALDRAHEAKILRNVAPVRVTVYGRIEPTAATKAINDAIRSHQAMDAIGGY